MKSREIVYSNIGYSFIDVVTYIKIEIVYILQEIRIRLRMSTKREIEIKWSLRQNIWKLSTGVFNTIQRTNIIICPGYHSCESCPNDPTGLLHLRTDNKKGNKYINDISVGDYAIIFATGEKSPLCIRIKSEAYRKEIPEITIYKKWGYKNAYNSEEVEVCLTGQNTRDFTHTEIMVAYVRDIEVIGIIDCVDYSDIVNKYKCLQTSIAQNKTEVRFINI